MLIRSSLPWRDVDDFGKYRQSVLAALAEQSATLCVQRDPAPYRWNLTTKAGQIALMPQESGLKAYFVTAKDSSANVLLPGHSNSVPASTSWCDLDAAWLLQEYKRWQDAVALTDSLNASAPAEAAHVVIFDELSELAQCALRTLCFETPVPLCAELENVARALITRGYASATVKGMLVRRAVWEVEPAQRKLARLRVEFSPS